MPWVVGVEVQVDEAGLGVASRALRGRLGREVAGSAVAPAHVELDAGRQAGGELDAMFLEDELR